MRDAIELVSLLKNANLQAFLHVVRVGEGTADLDGYRRHFGGKLFVGWGDHPREAITAGLGKNKYTSTAAGAYQFLTKTWDECAAALGLRDFTPKNQDIAAAFLIDRRGALDDVISGRFDQAVRKCNREWASLPGSPYGQPTKTLAQARATYERAGGQYAHQQEAPMAPFIAAALPLLMQAAPNLIRIFSDSPRGEKNAQAAAAVAEIAMQATGESNIEAATAAIQTDPAKAAEFREQVHVSMGDLLGMVERINAMEQSNVKAAREFNEVEPMFLDFGWLKLKFIHLLSLMLVVFSAAFAWTKFDGLSESLQGAIITLMIVGGFSGVIAYWLGSSSGSDRKTSEMLAKK